MRRIAVGAALLAPAVLLTPVHANAAVQQLRITFDPVARVAPGSPATVSGRLEQLEDGVWKPSNDSLSYEASAVTHSYTGAVGAYDGRFSWRFDFVRTTKVKFRASIDGSSAEATATVLPNALRPVKLSFTKFSLDKIGVLTMKGKADQIPGGSLELQHAYPGENEWELVKRFPARESAVSLSKFFYARSGRFRLAYKGDTDFKPAASPTKSVLRWNTRLSAKFSPRKLRVGTKVKATGTLLRYYPAKKKHAAYPGRNVQLIFRCKGEKTWYNGGWAKTDKKGRYTRYSKTYCDSYWEVVFWGATDTWASGTSSTYVDTYGRLRARVRSASLPNAVTPPSLPPLPSARAVNLG